MQFSSRGPLRSNMSWPSWVALTAVLSLASVSTAARAQDAPAAPTAPAPGITVNAVIEANYTWNFNEPFNGSNTYLYNQKEGQFAVNLADLRIGKAVTPESRAGFFLRLIDGEVRKTNFNLGEGSYTDPKALPNILEAYGSYLVPLGAKDLKVDLGQFVTHVGYETIDIGTNNFFSRNFLFQYPSPFYNAGLRAAYPLGSKTTLSGFLLNRYNGNNDTGNRAIAPGFQVVQTLSPASALVLNGLTSYDNLAYDGSNPGTTPPVNNKTQNVLDLVYSNQFSPGFKLAVEGLYRWGDDPTGKSYNVPGIAGYLIFPFKGGNTAALRAEYLSQSTEGAFVLPSAETDKKPNLSSITASYELKSFAGMRTLFELRFDSANTSIFPGDDVDEFKKNQTTFTIGQVFSF